MIKNLLATIGFIIVLIMAGIFYLGSSAIDFKAEQTPFIEEFMQDFSAQWQINDVQDRFSDSFLSEIKSNKGRHLIQTLQSLGQYQSMSNMVVNQYNSDTTGKAVNFNFTAHFTKGQAVMNIHLIELDDSILVNGLYITPIETEEPFVLEQQV